ncbi:aminotransferase class V-fold PLP-dependent enzyme [Candidatus Dormiibacter inghamiae]
MLFRLTGMEGRELLLIPGPVSVEPEVLEALGRPVRAHYGDDWAADYALLTENLRQIFRTRGDVFLLFGPGTAANEAALASALAPGDEVIVCSNGMFGERLRDLSVALGLQVHLVAAEVGYPLLPELVEAAISQHPAARLLAVVHHETSAGLLNPVREICRLGRRHGLLTLVDAISSLGGVKLEMDDWGIDICSTVANKALGGPIGIAPLAVGDRVWAAVEDGRAKRPGWYLNLSNWRDAPRTQSPIHPHPTTMPTNVIDALAVAVKQILDSGLEERHRRCAAAADRVREGLGELGFSMVVEPPYASPLCTAVWSRPGMDVAHYQKWMRSERGLRLGGGLGRLYGKSFRVGHMGRAAEPDVVDRFLNATSDYLALRTA